MINDLLFCHHSVRNDRKQQFQKKKIYESDYKNLLLQRELLVPKKNSQNHDHQI